MKTAKSVVSEPSGAEVIFTCSLLGSVNLNSTEGLSVLRGAPSGRLFLQGGLPFAADDAALFETLRTVNPSRVRSVPTRRRCVALCCVQHCSIASHLNVATSRNFY
jgi:hypothetical protein